ncbi:hypothetical protein SASPL_130782 [Salvia splendens]|uniref:Uncharacterized protein n=1 Tax=Salvia splendens TaxID=180675 RepID=A0A8X8X810_SALSN|nr:hypothetical protein SASPL_130782 [Salvia splendens]
MKNTDPHWLGTDVPDQVLFKAGVRIECELGCQLTRTDLKDRVQALEIRYHTFKALVAFPRVRWDFKWKFIHPDVVAYYYQDEPEFLRLASLFGLDDVVWRKLFDEALEINDCESAIGEPPHYYVPCPERGGGMMPKVGHSTPWLARTLALSPLSTPDRESCASCSPLNMGNKFKR